MNQLNMQVIQFYFIIILEFCRLTGRCVPSKSNGVNFPSNAVKTLPKLL